METINHIFTFVNSKGKDKVCINKSIFVSPVQLAKATGISSYFDILIGSDISVEYYKEGDAMAEGVVCTKNDTIVKEFTVVLSAQLQAYKMAAAFGTVLKAA